MAGISAICCLVKSDVGSDVKLEGESGEWQTMRWTDEFGNSVAPFFTSLATGRSFIKDNSDWQLKCYPVSFVVECILVDINQATTFYTMDPVSTTNFKALSPVQFLTELICRKHTADIGMQDLVSEHPDIVPIEDLIGDGRDCSADGDYRRIMTAADLIFGIDISHGQQYILYGRLALEELVLNGQSNILGIFNVGLDQETTEIEQLANLVFDIKGHHDCYEAGAI
jgi:hypothetical protein